MVWKLGLIWGLFIGAVITSYTNRALAQITPDTTLPNNSSVKLEGNTRIISGGTQAKGNLFHSFEQFSVPTGSTAYFNNATDIQNIISRVTGGSISNIDGIIKANGTANLFLINPYGIIFGSNAQLNIGGSFVATTASAIKFGDQGFFSATNPNTPPLLTVNPSAFLFNQIEKAPIQNTSVAPAGVGLSGYDSFGLRVRDGRSLLLVGGNINIDGGELNAFGGRVELGGLTGQGTVGLNFSDKNLSLSFPNNIELASVLLTNGASVNVGASNSGSIAITARNIDITNFATLNGGLERNLGFSNAQAGDIELHAQGTIRLAGSFISNIVETGAIGKAGNINIKTGSLEVINGLLESLVLGQGDAGNINITASDTVSFREYSGAYSTIEAGAIGKGGNITISSRSLSLSDNAQLQVSTSGKGSAGNVFVKAIDSVSLTNGFIFSTVESGATGNGGNVNINAASFSLKDGAQVQTLVRETLATQPAGKGNAGNVKIDVNGAVTIDGIKNEIYLSAIFSYVGKGAIGNGGDINIKTGSLEVINGALLESLAQGQGDAGNINITASDTVSFKESSGAYTTIGTGAIGKAGDINIKTGSLTVTDGARLNTGISGQGNAGNININARELVLLNGLGSNGLPASALTNVELGAVGNAGNINIKTGSLEVINGALLESRVRGQQGDAGNIDINASDTVSFKESSGAYSIIGVGAIGKGGNINIETGSLTVTDGARLNTGISGQGNAGDISINARDFVLLDGLNSDRLPASALTNVEQGAVGNAGSINIKTRSLEVINGALLESLLRGRGNAGNINITAKDTVSFKGASSFSTVESGAIGNGGNVNINATSLSLKDGAQVQTLVRGASDTQPAGNGSAGNVKIDVSGAVTIEGVKIDDTKNEYPSAIFSDVGEGAIGNGGNINISAGSFF